jgi:hypothetical protein
MDIDVQTGYILARAAEVYGRAGKSSKGSSDAGKAAKQSVGAIDVKSNQRDTQIIDIVGKSIAGQYNAYTRANNNTLWGTITDGRFTVDSRTKIQARKDIAEDGYWSPQETADRLFDYAMAISSGNLQVLGELKDAVKKGFSMTESSMGGDLPTICHETIDAVYRRFDQRLSQFDRVIIR